MTTIDNLNTVANYLARRDIPELSLAELQKPVDVLILLGSSLVEPIHVAAKAMQQGIAKQLLISGGIGHSTSDLYAAIADHPKYKTIETAGRAEADIIFDVLTRHLGIDAESILIENKSTTCGFNAEKSRETLDERGIAARSLLLVQDPTMQRRSHACFERRWEDLPSTRILSFAPFIPIATKEADGYVINGSTEEVWPYERFVSLVLGEIPRLRDDENGYGPKGHNFIGHVDIPDEVLVAYSGLASQYPELVRV